ncbi:hypothetical protein BLA29_014760 [Euroglyphus maynei]|uniref:Uncharacterized protein n=1 Tax=Euroglyphus maynei TaxID=6958 RepID=A0A1Y3ASW9_EURMA|nr:hypothetical protein BLA29_014760 [Euroglyphus maynei]
MISLRMMVPLVKKMIRNHQRIPVVIIRLN